MQPSSVFPSGDSKVFIMLEERLCIWYSECEALRVFGRPGWAAKRSRRAFHGMSEVRTLEAEGVGDAADHEIHAGAGQHGDRGRHVRVLQQHLHSCTTRVLNDEN